MGRVANQMTVRLFSIIKKKLKEIMQKKSK